MCKQKAKAIEKPSTTSNERSDIINTQITCSKNTIKTAGEEALIQLEKSYIAITELSKKRQEEKLSNSRVSAIAKELRELIKVLSVYTV